MSKNMFEKKRKQKNRKILEKIYKAHFQNFRQNLQKHISNKVIKSFAVWLDNEVSLSVMCNMRFLNFSSDIKQKQIS